MEEFSINQVMSRISINKRKCADGTITYRFRYRDSENDEVRNRQIPSSYIQHNFGAVENFKKALLVRDTLNQWAEANNLKSQLVESWKKDNDYLSKMLIDFKVFNAKNSECKNYEGSLRNHAFPFFVKTEAKNNIAAWGHHFDEWVDYLRHEACCLNRGGARISKQLSTSTINNTIKALNKFLKFCYKQKVIPYKMSVDSLADNMESERDLSSIVSEDEMEAVFNELEKRGFYEDAAFFRVGFEVGMRFSEQLGLSINCISDSKIEDKLYQNLMQSAGMTPYYGYLTVFDQLAPKARIPRIHDGQLVRKIDADQIAAIRASDLPRKPLKSRKKILEGDARVNVIRDAKTWKILCDRFKRARDLYKKRFLGPNTHNYLLFDGIHRSTHNKRVKAAFIACGLRPRTHHCLRHTVSTRLWTVNDSRLPRIWLGHKSARVAERYNHITQRIAREARLNKVLDRELAMDLID